MKTNPEEYQFSNGTPHTLHFDGSNLPSDTRHIAPRAHLHKVESTINISTGPWLPRIKAPLEIIDFDRLEDTGELVEWMEVLGAAATKQLVVVSHMAYQAAVMSKLNKKLRRRKVGNVGLAYPGDMNRDDTGQILSAGSIHVPEPARMTRAGDVDKLAEYREIVQGANRLIVVNKTPHKNLSLRYGDDKILKIPHAETEEPMYYPRRIGAGKVGRKAVQVNQVRLTGMQNPSRNGFLTLVHPKAYFAYWHLTGDAQGLAQMAFPFGYDRDDESHQELQTFSKITQVGEDTLKRIQEDPQLRF